MRLRLNGVLPATAMLRLGELTQVVEGRYLLGELDHQALHMEPTEAEVEEGAGQGILRRVVEKLRVETRVEDAAQRLNAGENAASIVPDRKVDMASSLAPFVTVPLGVSVSPVPAFLLLYASVKFAVSPGARGPLVIVGVAVADVVPSYVFEFVAAVTVIARVVMLNALLAAPLRVGLVLEGVNV